MPKNGNRKGPVATDKNRRGKLPEKSMSFHGRGTMPQSSPVELRRPKTLPELFSKGQTIGGGTEVSTPPRLTKLLLNVTVQGSLGALQIIISPESTVSDLIDAAIRLYVKEARRPFLPESRYDLHYSQFSLESLGKDQKLISLGSRNFFLCGRKDNGASTETCSKEADKVTKPAFQWLKFIGF
ncbi:hypothetical protein AALP_AA4G148000 [Arabis alpina]|uniref:DUF7054 domain-containing protein n=1 Tax=Arabis alpina TaxID=50452 RepID=A0A087H3C2_ARAAL|nr:hypothetical protein AALP_AA4G148000 [Arabis alpina]